MSFKIKSIELTPIFIPFKEPVKRVMETGEGSLGMAIKAEEPWLGGDFVICKLVCNDGTVGLGESFVWLPETGIMPNQIIDIIKKYLGKYLIGENPFNVEKILLRMDNNIARNEVAKGILDMACYDLMGKLKGKPVYDLMGGKIKNEIPLAALIPLTDVRLMVGIAKSYYKQGYRTFRYKLGKNIQNDIEISEKIRRTLGNEVRLRVDYNQAYTPEEAVRAIKSIEPFGIDFAEQPVKADDYIGMAYVQQRVNTPLMAHEGFFNLRDFITLVELNAVGVLGINSERPGGVTNALRAIDYADKKGISTVIHNQPLGIASAMHIHMAVAKYNSLGYATELFGHVMLEDDLIVKPLDYSRGVAKVPDGPGWGVILDEKVLQKYSTSPTIAIE